MATLNTSTNGPHITRCYQAVVNGSLSTGAPASSQTYGQWAVFSVQAPLASAFQQDVGKESVLKVQSTGEGELLDLVDEFSDGRIQFAFVKVKDPNTTLPKSVLIAWCGEGVPERTKGYFTSHLAAVSKILHGYHIQITARGDTDLTPESIVQKVADASGSKYSGGGAPETSSTSAPRPQVATKPVFTPTQVSSAGNGGYNPMGRLRNLQQSQHTDEAGWGADAPPVTRTQLERVAPAYKPTEVDMGELTSQQSQPASQADKFSRQDNNGPGELVKGGYQPVGKVDIAAIRRQAQESGNMKDDRPSTVKGSYEPVGKVDIAAIRAKAQPQRDLSPPKSASPIISGSFARSQNQDSEPKSLSERSAAFTQSGTSGRLSSMPKPKLANKFGQSSFVGTKPPLPGGFEAKTSVGVVPVGTASRTFADEGGKTPAQIWAEKKARQRGSTPTAENLPSSASTGGPTLPITSQPSGGEWKSGYSGKSWAAVETTRTGQSATSGASEQRLGQDEPPEAPTSPPTGGVGAIRDRFKEAAPMGGPPQQATRSGDPPHPHLDLASKPNAGARGVAIPGLPIRPQPAEEVAMEMSEEVHARLPTPPPQPPRSPSPEPSSPIRVAMPVSRSKEQAMEPPEERFSPPPMPVKSMAEAIPPPRDLSPELQVEDNDPARSAGVAIAASSFGDAVAQETNAQTTASGKRALIQYDYQIAEDNELELREGEYVTNIEMVDEDWWMGQNARGETGLFPSNYVELVEDEDAVPAPAPALAAAETSPAAPAAHAASRGQTATAIYDYEAAEDNELSFPDEAKITGVVSYASHTHLLDNSDNYGRSFRTMTGGLDSTMERRVSFLPTTWYSTSERYLAEGQLRGTLRHEVSKGEVCP